MKYVASLIGALASAVACGNNGPSLAPRVDPIIGGSVATAGQFPTVVALAIESGPEVFQTFCTGTLVAPDIVLTAAHCQELDDQYDTIWVIVDGLTPQSSQGRAIAVAHSVRDASYDVEFTMGVDVALLFLEEEVDDRAPSPIWLPPLAVQSPLQAVGFGTADPSDSGTAGTLRYLSTEPTISCDVLWDTFRDQGATDEDIEGLLAGRTFDEMFVCTNMADDTGVCFGDSGGPAFVTLNGTPTVTGIASFVGDEFCSTYGMYAVPHRAISFFAEQAPQLLCQVDGVCNEDCTGGVDIDCGCDVDEDCGPLFGRHECSPAGMCEELAPGQFGEACAGDDDCAAAYCGAAGLCTLPCESDEACPANATCELFTLTTGGECVAAVGGDGGCAGCSGGEPAGLVVALTALLLGLPRCRGQRPA